MRVYLDSCLVIYLVEGSGPFHDAVVQAIRSVAGVELCVSDLVRMECRTGALRRGDLTVLDEFDTFFRMTKVLTTSGEVFDLATRIRATEGVKTPDAIHLASAITHNCDEFWTNDTRLSAEGIKIPIRVVSPN